MKLLYEAGLDVSFDKVPLRLNRLRVVEGVTLLDTVTWLLNYSELEVWTIFDDILGGKNCVSPTIAGMIGDKYGPKC